MKLSIDVYQGFSSKPPKDEPSQTFANINNNLVNGWAEYSIDEIKTYILNGHCVSGGHFNNNRKALNWQGQQVFLCDVDSPDSPSPNEAIDIINTTFGRTPLMVYKSFSSNDSNNKYRVLVASNKVITDPKVALSILRGLTCVLKGDTSCIDLARFLYGTTQEKLVLATNNIISSEVLVKFSENYPQPTIAKKSLNVSVMKDKIANLSSLEKARLSTLLKMQKHYLNKESDKPRYERLKLLGVSLASTGFVSWELAKYLITQMIEKDEELKQKYITDYDKDYLEIVEGLYNWRAAQ